jgi:hypothetical protein
MLALSWAPQSWAGDAPGLWEVNPARSSVRYTRAAWAVKTVEILKEETQ